MDTASSSVLIIDNEEDILILLQDILEMQGLGVISARDYDSALCLLSSRQVDLILCDIILEGKTGIDILEKVKEMKLSTPVIMMTGMPNVDSVTESLRLGAFDYIIKPFQLNRFVSVVKKALHHKELLDIKQKLEIENEVYKEHLERLVDIRTAELEQSNELLRKEIAERINAQKLLQIQRDLGFNLNLSRTVEDAVNYAFDALFQIEEIDAGAFYLADDVKKDLTLLYHRGLSDEFVQQISYYAPESDRTQLAFQGKTLYLTYRQLVEEQDPRSREGLQVVAIIPVKYKNHVISVLNVASHRYTQINPLTQNALESIASQLGEVIARINAETALRISDQRREMAMEASSEGTWDYDLRTNTVYFGTRWFTILGYAPDELPQSMETFMNLLHPDDRDSAITKVFNHRGLSGSFTLEYRMKTKDGQWRWVLSKGKVFQRDEHGSPLRIVGTHTDITDRKLAEAEILRTNLELDQIFNSTSDGMCLVTNDYTIMRINAAMLKLFQWQVSDVLGKRYFDLLSNTGFDFVGMTKEFSLPSFDRLEHDFTMILPNQMKLYLALTSVPLKNIEDRQEGFLINIRNITRRVTAEEQARIKEQQLIHADKMKSLGVLVSGMAHEINNPNNFIMLNTSILLNVWDDIRSVLEERYQRSGEFLLANIAYSEMRTHIPELLNGIQDGSQRIKSIISSLKEYARGGVSDMTEDVNLNAVLKEAILLTNNLIEKSTNHFDMAFDDRLPTIKGSFHRMEQVFINLIQNACQALTHKDQRISIRTKWDVCNHKVFVMIQDEGVGISHDKIHKIFDPFYTTKRESGGCGLGLSICAGIVKEHGGGILFSSEPEKGTTVTLEFPLASA